MKYSANIMMYYFVLYNVKYEDSLSKKWKELKRSSNDMKIQRTIYRTMFLVVPDTRYLSN
jgi:hypothetical protein